MKPSQTPRRLPADLFHSSPKGNRNLPPHFPPPFSCQRSVSPRVARLQPRRRCLGSRGFAWGIVSRGESFLRDLPAQPSRRASDPLAFPYETPERSALFDSRGPVATEIGLAFDLRRARGGGEHRASPRGKGGLLLLPGWKGCQPHRWFFARGGRGGDCPACPCSPGLAPKMCWRCGVASVQKAGWETGQQCQGCVGAMRQGAPSPVCPRDCSPTRGKDGCRPGEEAAKPRRSSPPPFPPLNLRLCSLLVPTKHSWDPPCSSGSQIPNPQPLGPMVVEKAQHTSF